MLNTNTIGIVRGAWISIAHVVDGSDGKVCLLAAAGPQWKWENNDLIVGCLSAECAQDG